MKQKNNIMDYVKYFNAIRKLREEFADKLGLSKHTEAYKIWARWVITHRSLFPQKNIFLLSDDLTTDTQIIIEITDKGVSTSDALKIYEWLIMKSTIINNIPIDGIINIVRNDHVLGDDKGVFSHVIDETIINKMNNLYITNNILPFSGCESRSSLYDKSKKEAIWICYTLYDLLEGKGLQWAVPRTVMRALTIHYGCKTELFASPINCYYQNYYSLFSFDMMFGSKGNFFDADPSEFTEGSFQINPPFIDPLFTELTKRILLFLSKAELNGKTLTFVYIMPEWSDCDGYEQLIASRYCVKVIKLLKDSHYYYHYDSCSYIRARFGTSVIIMSTDPSISSYEAERDIRNGFKYINTDYG